MWQDSPGSIGNPQVWDVAALGWRLKEVGFSDTRDDHHSLQGCWEQRGRALESKLISNLPLPSLAVCLGLLQFLFSHL